MQHLSLKNNQEHSKKIKVFPEFTKLDLTLKDSIDNFTNQYESFSDFNFTSIFCWDTSENAQVSVLNDNLVLTLPNYITGEPVVSIIGDHNMDSSIKTLLTHCHKISLVPEIVIENVIQPESFKIEEDHDNFDYIYDLKKLASFSGNELKKKRNKYNSFSSTYTDKVKPHHYLIKTIADIERLIVATNHWHNNANNDEARLEKIAIQRLLANYDKFNLVISEVLIENKVVAFSINEIIHKNFAICHFEKAILVHDGVYSYLVKHSAQDLLNRNCVYVNWEQDLGLPGLRKSKLSYKPTRMLKKYTISLKE